jgi:hypothetical protein
MYISVTEQNTPPFRLWSVVQLCLNEQFVIRRYRQSLCCQCTLAWNKNTSIFTTTGLVTLLPRPSSRGATYTLSYDGRYFTRQPSSSHVEEGRHLPSCDLWYLPGFAERLPAPLPPVRVKCPLEYPSRVPPGLTVRTRHVWGGRLASLSEAAVLLFQRMPPKHLCSFLIQEAPDCVLRRSHHGCEEGCPEGCIPAGRSGHARLHGCPGQVSEAAKMACLCLVSYLAWVQALLGPTAASQTLVRRLSSALRQLVEVLVVDEFSGGHTM